MHGSKMSPRQVGLMKRLNLGWVETFEPLLVNSRSQQCLIALVSIYSSVPWLLKKCLSYSDRVCGISLLFNVKLIEFLTREAFFRLMSMGMEYWTMENL